MGDPLAQMRECRVHNVVFMGSVNRVFTYKRRERWLLRRQIDEERGEVRRVDVGGPGRLPESIGAAIGLAGAEVADGVRLSLEDQRRHLVGAQHRRRWHGYARQGRTPGASAVD